VPYYESSDGNEGVGEFCLSSWRGSIGCLVRGLVMRNTEKHHTCCAQKVCKSLSGSNENFRCRKKVDVSRIKQLKVLSRAFFSVLQIHVWSGYSCRVL
jgi:hypothetical protein